MTVVALKELKKELKKSIDNADEETVKEILSLLNKRQSDDWWDDLSKGEKEAIEEGLKDVKAGRLTPHEEVWSKYSKRIAK